MVQNIWTEALAPDGIDKQMDRATQITYYADIQWILKGRANVGNWRIKK